MLNKDFLIKKFRLEKYRIDLRRFKEFSQGEGISFILLFISSFILNKSLPKSGLGEFSYYSNLILFLYPLFSLNLADGYNRFLSGENFDRLLVVRLVRKLSIAATFIMFTVIYLLSSSLEISSLAFIIIYYERLNYYRARILTKVYRKLKVFHALVVLFGVLYLLHFNIVNFLSALLVYGISYIIVSAFGFLLDKEKNEGSRRGKEVLTLSKILKYTVPVMCSSMVLWLLNFSDQHFIRIYYSPTQLGEYSISYRALNILRMVTGFFLIYWPILYFREAEQKNFKKLFNIRKIFMGLIILITIVSIIFSDFLYLLIGAGKYIEFTIYFKVLIISELFRIIAGIFMTYRSFKLETYYNLFIVLFVSLVNILLNYLFLETSGIIFAAYSTLIATFLYFLLAVVFSSIPERKFYLRNKS